MKTKILLILICLAGIVQSIIYYTYLPRKVATHFGTSGLPNGWMTSTGNLLVSATLFIFMTVLMLATSKLTSIIPVRFVNLPNKDYWLADGRKEQSLAYISGCMHIFGIAINLFFLFLNHMVFLANFERPARLNETVLLPVLIIFLLFIAAWFFTFIRHFRKPV